MTHRLFILSVLSFGLAFSASSEDGSPASLSDAQKLGIRESQINLVTLQAEKYALESRLKDLTYSLIPAAQKELQDRSAAVTPAGYSLQPDLTLRSTKPETK